MRIDNHQLAALTKNGQVEAKKVPETGTTHKNSQPVSTNSPAGGNISQLTQLLTQLNALQRLFTTFTSYSSQAAPPSPVTQLLSQLLLPQNQTAIIAWLKQGAGKQVIQQLLQQLAQADSPLNQWLQTLPPDKQKEFKALLKLAAEQRVAQATQEQPSNSYASKDPATKDSEQNLLQLHLLQPNGREMKLAVRRDTSSGASKKASSKPQWRVNLVLPVGKHECVHAAALWDQRSLSLCFEADNIPLLKRTEALTPLLTARLEMLGIRSEAATFKIRPPEHQQVNTEGFSIMV